MLKIDKDFINTINYYNEKFTANLQEAMEQEINCRTKLLAGWHKVSVTRYTFSPEFAYELRCWVKENCSGEYYSSGRLWVFELSKDAVLFSLRYGG